MSLVQQSQLFQQLSNAVAAAAAVANCDLNAVSSSAVTTSFEPSLTTTNGSSKVSQHFVDQPNFASQQNSLSSGSSANSAHSNRTTSPFSSSSNSINGSSATKRSSPLLGALFGNATSSSGTMLASNMGPSGKSCSPLTGQSSPKRTLSPVSRHQIELQLRQLQLEQQQIVQQLQLSSHRQYLLSEYNWIQSTSCSCLRR